MKLIVLTLTTFLFFSCRNQEKENSVLPTDTLIVKPEAVIEEKQLDSLSVENNFLLGAMFSEGDEMTYFTKKLKNTTKTTVSKERNQHEENKFNTIKVIEWDKSSIRIITTPPPSSKVLIDYVRINDSNIVLRNGITVGDHAEKVFSALKIKYDSNKNYKFLELTRPDGWQSTLTFYFKDNVLNEVFYWSYFD